MSVIGRLYAQPEFEEGLRGLSSDSVLTIPDCCSMFNVSQRVAENESKLDNVYTLLKLDLTDATRIKLVKDLTGR
jgi:hypothetical protein